MFIYINSHKKHYLIDSTKIDKLEPLQKWLEKLREIIETFFIDSEETIHALKVITDLASLPFSLAEIKEDELNQALKIIAEVNFPSDEEKEEEEEKSNEPITLRELQSNLIIGLVNTELAMDLESALKVAQQTPYLLLKDYLSDRIDALSGTSKLDKSTAKSLVQELTDGTFFGDSKKDGFKKGVMNALNATSITPVSEAEEEDTMPDSVKQALNLGD